MNTKRFSYFILAVACAAMTVYYGREAMTYALAAMDDRYEEGFENGYILGKVYRRTPDVEETRPGVQGAEPTAGDGSVHTVLDSAE